MTPKVNHTLKLAIWLVLAATAKADSLATCLAQGPLFLDPALVGLVRIMNPEPFHSPVCSPSGPNWTNQDWYYPEVISPDGQWLAGIDHDSDVDEVISLWHRDGSQWDWSTRLPAFGYGNSLAIYTLSNSAMVTGTGSIACGNFDQPHDFAIPGQECGTPQPLVPQVYPIANWKEVMAQSKPPRSPRFASPSPVPEVSSIWLLGLSLLALGRRRPKGPMVPNSRQENRNKWNMSKYILDSHHQVVLEPDLLKWAKWFEEDHRGVARTQVGESDVSTVFLGLNYQFGDGPPLLFETMVFGGPLDQETWRCSTWDEALAQHETAIQAVRDSQSPFDSA